MSSSFHQIFYFKSFLVDLISVQKIVIETFLARPCMSFFTNSKGLESKGAVIFALWQLQRILHGHQPG